MMIVKRALLVAVLVAGCGGKQKTDDTEPTGPSVLGQQDTGDSTDHSGNMIPADKMEEVSQNLGRRRDIVSHCLALAMEAKSVPRGTHGRVTFEIIIDQSGHASTVKVVKTDIQDAGVLDCATKRVQDTAFPQLPKQYETSYTFAMEAN